MAQGHFASRIFLTTLATSGIAALPALTSAQPAVTRVIAGQPRTGAVTPSPTPPRSDGIDILPLIDVTQSVSGSQTHSMPIDHYVRLEITRQPFRAATQRLYSNEVRDDVARFFVGRTTSRVLTARFQLSGTTSVASTVTLAAAAQRSNRREGENFTSELAERRMVTPFFRVDPGSAMAISVNLVSSRRADADITRNILSVVDGATRLVAPSSSLVSSLTAPRLTDAANFADNAISQLFSETIAEASQLDVPVRNWGGASRLDHNIAIISATFPFRTEATERDTLSVGTWAVSFSPPIQSIFTETPVGSGLGDDFKDLTPSHILGYRLDDGVTLGEVIRGDDGVSAALLRFDTKTPGTADGAVISDICARIAEKAHALGLNRNDIAATVWAVTWSGILRPSLVDALWAKNGDRHACAAIERAASLGLSAPELVDNTIVPRATITDIETNVDTINQRVDGIAQAVEDIRSSMQPPPPSLDTERRATEGREDEP